LSRRQEQTGMYVPHGASDVGRFTHTPLLTTFRKSLFLNDLFGWNTGRFI
jgi:hypothetical protein